MEIEAYLFVYGMKRLYVTMKRSVVWWCLWPHLIPWGSLQGPSGEEYIKTSSLNTHVCSFHFKKCLLLLCSLDPWITWLKKTLMFSHLKFQNRGLNLHSQKCRQILEKQSQLEEMEEAGGIAERSSVERDHTAARGHVKTFLWYFCREAPCVCGLFWESWLLRMSRLTVGFLLCCCNSLKEGREQHWFWWWLLWLIT